MTKKNAGRFSRLEIGEDRGVPNGPAPARDGTFYMNEALTCELAGEHEKALTNYTSALGDAPLLTAAWVGQLWMLLYLDEVREASTWADKALQSFPKDPDIIALKSLAQWRNGYTIDAMELNDAALGLYRNSANVWLAKGEMQVTDDSRAGLTCFRHAAAAPGNTGLTNLRACDMLLGLRRYADAVPFGRQATTLLPDSSWAWYGYGRAQQNVGRVDLARTAFEHAYRLTPRDPRYRRGIRGKTTLIGKIMSWFK